METKIIPAEPSILALAFLGDALYEAYMRKQLLRTNLVRPAQLSKAAADLACAPKQAELCHALEPLLREDELAILRRGRNAKTRHQPRGDTLSYRHATGLEALLGYLDYSGQQNRLQDILQELWHIATATKTGTLPKGWAPLA